MASNPMPVPVSAEQPQAKISAVGRIVGVIFSPKATFEDIVRKPTWVLPLVVMVVLSALAAFGINQKVNWRQYMSDQIDKSPRAAQLSAEQKQQQIEIGAKYAPYSTYVFGILVPVVGLFVITLIMWGAYNLFAGANVNFGTSLGIVAHAFVPTFISSLIFFLVLFLKPYGTLDLDNPIATNVAAFLPEDSAKWLQNFGKNLDIFVIWITLLIAVGFAAANPKKLKGAKPYSIAFGMLIFWIVLRVGIAFAFS
jgi:hypothetical protein